NGGDENLESLLKQVHHDDKALVLQVIQDIKGGSYSEQITARFSTVEKICRHVKFFFNGIRNGRAELVRIVGVVIDVSNEIEKLELKQQVEIAEKTAHLKQEFLANISHEMRTPMNAIMGMTNFLLRTQLNDSQESFAKSIKESSENLLSIINNVLDISKIESGVLTLFPKLFSIKDLVRKIDNLFRIEVSRKKLSLDFDTGEDEALYFEADENKVVQVVSNYISNAIKFTDRGGISVDFQVEKIDNAKVIIKISVTDTGIGIAEEDQKKLFSKFTQLDSSMTRSYQGAGLGLSICRELARLMGGEAGVVSREGLGSTFWFTFTGSLVLSEQDRVEKEDFVSSHQILNGMNVLVVEDRFLNYKVISMMLESMGCKSVIAQNGQLGLEAFEKEAFDLILMDIQMPVMDGLTAVKELRKRHDNLPPVVALTANALEGDADYFISQGMDDYISKPVKEDLLKEKLLFWAAKKMK
ncbi:MAG: response regulator, partial [Bacteroidales bacterium]|nr:response regulator [Bacteroidales bacterium]